MSNLIVFTLFAPHHLTKINFSFCKYFGTNLRQFGVNGLEMIKKRYYFGWEEVQ